MPSGMMTTSAVPTSTPVPIAEMARICFWDRERVSGREPAKKDLKRRQLRLPSHGEWKGTRFRYLRDGHYRAQCEQKKQSVPHCCGLYAPESPSKGSNTGGLEIVETGGGHSGKSQFIHLPAYYRLCCICSKCKSSEVEYLWISEGGPWGCTWAAEPVIERCAIRRRGKKRKQGSIS